MTTSNKILGVASFAALLSAAVFAGTLFEPNLANAQSADKTATLGKTIVEKTTATSYTVSKRKVGLKGGRPYKPQTEEVEGGVRKDISVNGVPVETQVIIVDAIAPIANSATEGDYYTNKPEAMVYEQQDSNIHVHNIGRLNR